jgi:hypothetical protein
MDQCGGECDWEKPSEGGGRAGEEGGHQWGSTCSGLSSVFGLNLWASDKSGCLFQL